MAFTVDAAKFKTSDALAAGVKGKRVLISGAGKDNGMGQAFALAAGLNGAESVAVHFHRSYEDGLDLVDVLREHGVNAFPVQADVTNLGDLWASRTYIIERMGGKVPNLVICNSGLTESGYSFGRSLREVEGESNAKRRARVRQAFVDNLAESRAVLDTKVDGFLAMTHLWSGEAVHANEPITFVYISSRQAIDPGVSVPGYALANWTVLQLPKVLQVNLGRNAELVTAFSVLYPFVRTGMTDEYAENPRVFGRWQPRMLETHEASEAFLQALSQGRDTLNGGMFEVMAEQQEGKPEGALKVSWQSVALNVVEEAAPWSTASPLLYDEV
ncbi:MAG: SDR family NAD(P)-dependent oxidoreductase [Dehalococcoidia bacterium]|nr:SDR family NAD(P)-dependent oxidoreductase [Dehalococcoidia bacterium]MCA9824608.1 SDR family NAD(P)-dependent oxidoreductase [Dehalococcoidia bacterium]MCA9844832.1 SDR family NAD(P)-dependent oxidoreductase [Dehalococcoidia bacterium]MCA9852952.1 SDR family NAD(P)-dependent oxidoreductase [Dehalococcoidia bacterium]